ncbi:MAG: hypothetical protein GY822_12000 [Deltaproteobacteria bacterium]|nr:hypothetical protein [Deltaproteobacteria bacterium]
MSLGTELLNQTDDKGNDVKVGKAAVDEGGNPVPEPMVDTYMADRAMNALKNQVVVRLRANKQGVQLNIKPGGGLSDPDLPQLKSRVEFFMDLAGTATPADAKKLLEGINGTANSHGNTPHKSGPFNHGQSLVEQLGVDGLELKDCLNEVLELTQTRHKFTVKNDKGLEVELSIDEVTAKTKLPEHNGPDGKPQTVKFYQVEGEMDHVQLKTSSNAAEFDLPSDVSSFTTDDSQTKWLENTSKDAGNVTMDIEPRLHDLKDLENPAERNNESYKQFKDMLSPLMDHLFPSGTTDAIQKGAEAADQMGLLPKDD